MKNDIKGRLHLGLPPTLYPYDHGYKCTRCNLIFEFYGDCERHIRETRNHRKYVRIHYFEKRDRRDTR